jgi:hypothetical protein
MSRSLYASRLDSQKLQTTTETDAEEWQDKRRTLCQMSLARKKEDGLFLALYQRQYCDSEKCQYYGNDDQEQYRDYAYGDRFQPTAIEEVFYECNPYEKHD